MQPDQFRFIFSIPYIYQSFEKDSDFLKTQWLKIRRDLGQNTDAIVETLWLCGKPRDSDL